MAMCLSASMKIDVDLDAPQALRLSLSVDLSAWTSFPLRQGVFVSCHSSSTGRSKYNSMASVAGRSPLVGSKSLVSQLMWRLQPCCQLSQSAPLHRRTASKRSIPPLKADYPWRVMVSLCITRPPQVAAVLDDVERRYFEQREQELEEQAVPSQHDDYVGYLERLQTAIDKQAKGLPVKGFTLEELSSQQVEKHEERIRVEQLVRDEFTPAGRTTEDDLNSVYISTNRCLDQSLYLVVKKTRKEHEWQFPQAIWPGAINLRQAAEAAVHNICGKDVDVKFYSSAPCGYISYKFPRDYVAKDQKIGAKVFIYKALLQSGTIELQPSSNYTEFQWLTRDKLNTVLCKRVVNKVHRFTFP